MQKSTLRPGASDASHSSIVEELIRNPKNGLLISQSAILDFELQKGFMLFYNLAIKNQPNTQVKVLYYFWLVIPSLF